MLSAPGPPPLVPRDPVAEVRHSGVIEKLNPCDRGKRRSDRRACGFACRSSSTRTLAVSVSIAGLISANNRLRSKG